jgi:hypothetical protein
LELVIPLGMMGALISVVATGTIDIRALDCNIFGPLPYAKFLTSAE